MWYFELPGEDGESKGAQDDPQAKEQPGEKLHNVEEKDGGVEEVDDEEDGGEMGRKDDKDEKL